jgi:hypothetical protein
MRGSQASFSNSAQTYRNKERTTPRPGTFFTKNILRFVFGRSIARKDISPLASFSLVDIHTKNGLPVTNRHVISVVEHDAEHVVLNVPTVGVLAYFGWNFISSETNRYPHGHHPFKRRHKHNPSIADSASRFYGRKLKLTGARHGRGSGSIRLRVIALAKF